MRRNLVLHVLLITGALGITVYLVIRYGIALVLIKNLWKWLVYGGRWIGFFLRRVLVKLATRKAMSPVWKALGLTAIIAYVSQIVKKHTGPRISAEIERITGWWKVCPWYIKAGVIIVALVLALFFGFGLWLLPFGLPYYSRMAIKLKVMWANSWLDKKTRALRVQWKCFLRGKKHVFCVRWARGARYWLICRERKMAAWAEEKVGKLVSKVTS